MKILDKYVTKHFLTVLIASNVISVLLFLLVSVLDSLNQLMVRKELSLFQIVQYFSYQVPQISYYAAPLSVLFGLLLSFGVLGQRSELTIMRVSGVSWGQLSRWPLVLTVIYAWLIYLVGAYLIPLANQESKFFELERIRKEARLPGANFWVFNSQDPRDQTAIHINLFLPAKSAGQDEARGLSAFRLDRNFFPVREIRAERAFYLGGYDWLFFGARIFSYKKDAPAELSNKTVTVETLPVKPKNFLSFEKWPQELSIDELKTYIKTLRTFGFDPREYQVEYAGRFSVPAACVILFGLALGVSIRMRRPRGIYLNMAVALLMSFIYFAIMAMCLSLGKSGKLPPFLAAWIGNIIFTAVSIYLLASQEKE